jgi:hypothetical protein
MPNTRASRTTLPYLFGRKSTGLGTGASLGINPDILGEDLVGGKWEIIVTSDDGRVELRSTGFASENCWQRRMLTRLGYGEGCKGCRRACEQNEQSGGKLHGGGFALLFVWNKIMG